MSAPESGPERPERTESFDTTQPAELDLTVGSGTVRIELVDDATSVRVVVRAGPGPWWAGRLGEVLTAVGNLQAPAPGGGAPGTDAVTATEISFSPGRSRLVLRTPRSGGGRTWPLDVVVTAPTRSRVLVRTGSASTEVIGVAAAVDASTGAGDVTLGDVADEIQVRTGSGDVRTGHLHRGGRLRSGSGDLVVDATSGSLDLVTGSGALRIGISAGVLAELDVSSGSGRATSTLPSATAPSGAADSIRVRGRTGSGDVVVQAATT
ncbi:MAG: DUF4097 family beta strand repeat-containing protein [Mycobacteriaceae bacterium]